MAVHFHYKFPYTITASTKSDFVIQETMDRNIFVSKYSSHGPEMDRSKMTRRKTAITYDRLSSYFSFKSSCVGPFSFLYVSKKSAIRFVILGFNKFVRIFVLSTT